MSSILQRNAAKRIVIARVQYQYWLGGIFTPCTMAKYVMKPETVLKSKTYWAVTMGSSRCSQWLIVEQDWFEASVYVPFMVSGSPSVTCPNYFPIILWSQWTPMLILRPHRRVHRSLSYMYMWPTCQPSNWCWLPLADPMAHTLVQFPSFLCSFFPKTIGQNMLVLLSHLRNHGSATRYSGGPQWYKTTFYW